jgi:hypothetical protein
MIERRRVYLHTRPETATGRRRLADQIASGADLNVAGAHDVVHKDAKGEPMTTWEVRG